MERRWQPKPVQSLVEGLFLSRGATVSPVASDGPPYGWRHLAAVVGGRAGG